MGDAVQISTSVTILNSLLGYQGVSLTEYSTSAVSAIAAGSKCEIASSFYRWESNQTINASSWTAITTATTAYLALEPSGTPGSMTVAASWTATAPVWSPSKQGFYASAGSSTRVVGSAYKVSNTQQETKILYVKGQDTIFNKAISIGSWDMDTSANSATLPSNIPIGKIFSIVALISNDAQDGIRNLEGVTSTLLSGYIQVSTNDILCSRVEGGLFDTSQYNDSGINRGYVNITYDAL